MLPASLHRLYLPRLQQLPSSCHQAADPRSQACPRSSLCLDELHGCLQSISAADPTSAAAGSSLPLSAGSVEFNKGVLTVTGMDQPLDCPRGFRLAWGSQQTGPTSTAG